MALRLYIYKMYFSPSKQEDNIICLHVITAYEIAEDKHTTKIWTKKINIMQS